jgi:hypothetical protein
VAEGQAEDTGVSIRAEGVRVAYPLFQAEGGGSTPTSALQLYFRAVELSEARQLVKLWHSRLPRFGRFACRVAYGAEFDGVFYAAAIWTNPLSRKLPQMTWLELNRMAVAPDAPRNTPSRMLAWMARDIRERLPEVETLVSYQDTEAHTGCIYRAAGWSATRRLEGDTWDRPSRPRADSQTVAPKHRWEKELGAPA